MNGVILFADDHVFNPQRIENALFQKFNSEGEFSILPIDNLSVLEKTVSSVSTYRAIILDWNFKQKSEEEGVVIPDETPYEFLQKNKIFSLVYIYSQTDIPKAEKEVLENIYPERIFFQVKTPDNDDVNIEHEKISKGILEFEDKNKHLQPPFLWSQAINSSVQSIFKELESADPNWIKEMYLTAKKDGSEPNAEVINVFQNLLNESIIQNKNLTKALEDAAQLDDIKIANKEESVAKLYSRIYYTQILNDAPIMTGDIFQFSDDEFAILITPECDVNSKKQTTLEFLKFTKAESAAFFNKNKKEKDIFNNKVPSRHILPSFPFEQELYHLPVNIDFKTAFIVKTKEEFEAIKRCYKLNSPYIYQLRQRYLAYLGRVGAPAIPPSLSTFNLK